LISDKEFKSYDELKKRLDKVLGLNGETPAPKTTVEMIKANPDYKPKPVAEDSPFVEPDLTEDDDLSYFAKLAEED